MTIEDCECLSAHQHACPAISEIRLCTNIILVFDFNDICHDLPGRSTKNVDLVAGGVIGKNLTSASYKSQWSQVHTASCAQTCHGIARPRPDRRPILTVTTSSLYVKTVHYALLLSQG